MPKRYGTRGANRPNVVSAKKSAMDTNGEYFDQTRNLKTIQGKPRHTVIDLCDFCLKEIRLNKRCLGLRRYYKTKFICKQCLWGKFNNGRRLNKNKYMKVIKENNLFVEFGEVPRVDKKSKQQKVTHI